jgi:AraC-like DNA-binding protein
MHCHDTIYAMTLVEQGASYCMGMRKSESLINSGEVGLINPGQVHSGEPFKNSPITYLMIYMDTEKMGRFFKGVSGGRDECPEFTSMIVKNPVVAKRFTACADRFIVNGGRLEKETALVEFVAGIIGNCGYSISPSRFQKGEIRSVRIAQEVLSSDLDRRMALDEISRQSGLSTYHLLRVFKRQTGVSPHNFRTQRRIEAAKSLLKRGGDFADVALATGFYDQSHFCKKFKEFIGATPGQYVMGQSLEAGGRM